MPQGPEAFIRIFDFSGAWILDGSFGNRGRTHTPISRHRGERSVAAELGREGGLPLRRVLEDEPGLHWSRGREEHAKIAHRIDPRLAESSILSYCLRRYGFGSATRDMAVRSASTTPAPVLATDST